MPNSKRLAAARLGETTQIAQELKWDDKEFIDVATGLVIRTKLQQE